MTAEQILKLIDEPGPMNDARARPLWELAYQFAVYNERNAAVDEFTAALDHHEAIHRQENNARLMDLIESLGQRLDALGAPRFPPGVPQ